LLLEEHPALQKASELQRSLENPPGENAMSRPNYWCRVCLARTSVSEESSASIIRVTRIEELGTTSAAIAIDTRSEEVLCEHFEFLRM
jgi:hypothetical protein